MEFIDQQTVAIMEHLGPSAWLYTQLSEWNTQSGFD